MTCIRTATTADTPRFAWYLHWNLPEPRWSWIQQNHQARNITRSYLASTSFVDSQVGRLLAGLAEAGLKDNTVVVLWSDHGYHLGEKAITGKNTLWERSTRVPLIFAGPGIPAGGRCTEPVELLDLYPTLIDLCRLPARTDLEGLSLLPQITAPQTPRSRPATTTHNPGNHGIRSSRYRYIRYADGSEELYDLQSDPQEWKNLIARPEMAQVLAEHRRWLPKTEAAHAAGSLHRTLTYDPQSDIATWEGQPVRRSDPVPE
jgi:choline-sulfatase